MGIKWTDSARQDLIEIGDYIAMRSATNAGRFVAELFERTAMLAEVPEAGRIVPEFGNVNIRELIHSNYRIVYRLFEETVQIIAVVEGHRLLKTGIEGLSEEEE